MSMPVISALDFTGENMVDETISKDSPMKTFYRNKTVFLTGGTGFLGQLFVEKLLRCNVKEIYVLARPKKNKTPTERIQSIFVGVVFSKVALIDPNYLTRIKLIDGDTRKPDLGISDDNRNDIIDNVEIVIHAAADVRFDMPLQELCFTNVRGTKAVTLLAEEMKKLIVFGYISTAYSQYYRNKIDEKFYPPPLDPEEMIRIAEYFDKHQTDELNIVTDKILQPWANTYVYTKSLSEAVVRRVLRKFPTVIIRPSIIISTSEDPIPGWSNNIYGMNGLIVGAGLGLIRVALGRKEDENELICADFVTNGTLAAIWDKAKESGTTDVNNFDESKSIVHITAQDPLKFDILQNHMSKLFFKHPSSLSIWVPYITTTESTTMLFILTILYHVIPAICMDFYFSMTNDKTRLLPLYRKTQDFLLRISYFSIRKWKFAHNNMKRILNSMSEEDGKFFPCNAFKFNLMDFSYAYMQGLKVYVAKEQLNNEEAAKRKFLMLRIAYYPVMVFRYICMGCLIYLFLRMTGLTHYLKIMFNVSQSFYSH